MIFLTLFYNNVKNIFTFTSLTIKYNQMRVYLLILSLFFCSITFAQNTISGSVTDSNNQPISGANIKVVGDSAGTVSDADGKFTLDTSKTGSLTLEVTSVGFESKSVKLASSNQKVSIKLGSQETKLNEIVVSASRTPERVLESPVTIERMGITQSCCFFGDSDASNDNQFKKVIKS